MFSAWCFPQAGDFCQCPHSCAYRCTYFEKPASAHLPKIFKNDVNASVQVIRLILRFLFLLTRRFLFLLTRQLCNFKSSFTHLPKFTPRLNFYKTQLSELNFIFSPSSFLQCLSIFLIIVPYIAVFIIVSKLCPLDRKCRASKNAATLPTLRFASWQLFKSEGRLEDGGGFLRS